MNINKKFKIKNKLFKTAILNPGILTLVKNLSKIQFKLMHGQKLISWIKVINKYLFFFFSYLGKKFEKTFLMLVDTEPREPVLKFFHYLLKYLGTIAKPLSSKTRNWFREMFTKKLNIKSRRWNV